MRKSLLAACGLLCSISANSAPDWRAMSLKCQALSSSQEVAECLRSETALLIKEETAENIKAQEARIKAQDRPKLIVRDTASSISNMASFSLGEKGASFTAQREKGQDSTLAKIAVFGIFDAWFDGKAQPFIGAAWSRDGSTSPKKDVSQVTFGAAGPLLQSSGPAHDAFTLFHTFQVSQREDRYSLTDGTVARLHFDLVWAPLASGDLLNGFAILPHVAGLWQRRTDAGTEHGNWRSVYAGVQVIKPFGWGAQRFKASLIARKLNDTSVPFGNNERRTHYANLSLDYFFYDPENKTAILQPSLFISRETGTDFLEYGKPTRKTMAGVRLKFN